jgi:hypothetical protein
LVHFFNAKTQRPQRVVGRDAEICFGSS